MARDPSYVLQAVLFFFVLFLTVLIGRPYLQIDRNQEGVFFQSIDGIAEYHLSSIFVAHLYIYQHHWNGLIYP